MSLTLLSLLIVSSWVLFWFALVAICAPAAALGRAERRPMAVANLGPALVCSWLTMAIGVPLVAKVHGFNWVTALLIPGVCPAALWLSRHPRASAVAFRDMVRWYVFRAVTPAGAGSVRVNLRDWAVPIVGIPLLSVLPLLAVGRDVRLAVPADFDTLWRTRQILAGGATVWDPLASLAAVLTLLSAANPLYVAAAIRVGLVTLTMTAAGILIAELRGRPWTIAIILGPLALAMLAWWVPAAMWAVALVTLVGAASLLRWTRNRRSRDVWHTTAALALAAGLLLPFAGNPEVLRVSRTAQYLEHHAAAQEALRLESSRSDDDWVVVAPPEQQLEVGSGRFYDLARFVSRFRDRTGDPRFRFDLGASRIYVFVEQRPLEPAASAFGVQFVAEQPASYRVARERSRLGQLARQICDQYRRTHAGVTVSYDDEGLRVYQIDR